MPSLGRKHVHSKQYGMSDQGPMVWPQSLSYQVTIVAVIGLMGCTTTPVDSREGLLIRAAEQRQTEKFIEVCHHTPASERDKGSRRTPDKVIRVGSEKALQAHLAHGDTVFGLGLDGNCEGDITVRIDPSLSPSSSHAPEIRGFAPRPVGVIEGPEGGRDEFVQNEVQYRVESEESLEKFLTNNGGKILRDDTVIIGTEGGGTDEVAGGGDGLYLIQFDPESSGLIDLPENAGSAGLAGEIAFSSIEAARGAALHFRERERGGSPNIMLASTALLEHPLEGGGHQDFAETFWIAHDSDPGLPGEQGLSTSAARALDYLRDTGVPPFSGGYWEPARVAVIDGGFDLAPDTGLGNADYNNNPFSPPLQVDVVDWDGRAGGQQGGWHGQSVFSACCAYPRNLFGAAGTGGNIVRPILIRASSGGTGEPYFYSFDLHMAIRSAWLMGADVINMSLGCKKGVSDRLGPFCSLNAWVGGDIQMAVNTAITDGVVVVAGAGNGDDQDISGDDFWPCKHDGVICVGAVNRAGKNVFNWGDGVDIWAPGYAIRTTPNPASGDELPKVYGTSFAAPFVSGVAGLLKTVDPSLRWDDVQDILQSTANCAGGSSPCPIGSPDPHVPRGYVDAFRAVQMVQENPPPQVEIFWPIDGDNLSWGNLSFINVNVQDPLAPAGFYGDLVLTSNLDGELCRTTGYGPSLGCRPAISSLGEHTITATATDRYGASAQDSIRVTLTNSPPMVSVLSPGDGDTFYTSQLITMRAQVIDRDETIDDSNIRWTSDIDGELAGGGNPRHMSTFLSAGAHVITVYASDAFGQESQDQVSITVLSGDGWPTAVILEPAAGSSFTTGDVITLAGSGTDPEDGDLPNDSYLWTSDVDGFLGAGKTIDVILTGSGCDGLVYHQISLEVTDSDGNTHVDSIVITVGRIC